MAKDNKTQPAALAFPFNSETAGSAINQILKKLGFNVKYKDLPYNQGKTAITVEDEDENGRVLKVLYIRTEVAASMTKEQFAEKIRKALL